MIDTKSYRLYYISYNEVVDNEKDIITTIKGAAKLSSKRATP